MLKIGEFSNLSKISIYMLRNYHELGLLEPLYIDEQTKYRYYGEEQLTRACRIQALKNMGFSLESIKGILEKCQTQENLIDDLTEHLNEKEKELEALQQKR